MTVMKKGIHPQYYKDATVTDTSSGAFWKVGSTVEKINVEISSVTHPFYTGKQRIVDTDDLVKKFADRMQKVDASRTENKRKKKIARRKSSVEKIDQKEKVTLKDVLKQFK
jgi:large subunit ribosomal protein L31